MIVHKIEESMNFSGQNNFKKNLSASIGPILPTPSELADKDNRRPSI